VLEQRKRKLPTLLAKKRGISSYGRERKREEECLSVFEGKRLIRSYLGHRGTGLHGNRGRNPARSQERRQVWGGEKEDTDLLHHAEEKGGKARITIQRGKRRGPPVPNERMA